MSATPVGLTQSQGWEMGVRKTLPLDVNSAWALVMSDAGRAIWFGGGGALAIERGATFVTADGTTGRVVSGDESSGKRGNMVRMRWQPMSWKNESTLQVRVLPAATGATMAFHHEKLASAEQRSEMLEHWQSVIEKLAAIAV